MKRGNQEPDRGGPGRDSGIRAEGGRRRVEEGTAVWVEMAEARTESRCLSRFLFTQAYMCGTPDPWL